MKASKIHSLFVLIFMFSVSCKTTKETHSISLNDPEKVWILEYINEPDIDFEVLFPEEKPSISFNLDEDQINGNDTCNGFFQQN